MGDHRNVFPDRVQRDVPRYCDSGLFDHCAVGAGRPALELLALGSGEAARRQGVGAGNAGHIIHGARTAVAVEGNRVGGARQQAVCPDDGGVVLKGSVSGRRVEAIILRIFVAVRQDSHNFIAELVCLFKCGDSDGIRLEVGLGLAGLEAEEHRAENHLRCNAASVLALRGFDLNVTDLPDLALCEVNFGSPVHIRFFVF